MTRWSGPLSVQWWKERLCSDPDRRDPVGLFVKILESQVTPTDTVLEIGAGAGVRSVRHLRGRSAKGIGIDMDPRVTTNPCVDVGMVGDATRTGLSDSSCDIMFCTYVLEHIEHPE